MLAITIYKLWFAKSFEIILQNFYSLLFASAKIGVPSPPNLGGKDSSFPLMYK